MYEIYDADKNNPEALSQLYKMMNYKPTSNKGEKLSTEQVANFLKVGKKEGDVYDDIMYYDDAKIKEIVLRQTFLIAKGYFDPKEYFQAIKIDNLDDQTFDNKIKAMFSWLGIIRFYNFGRYYWHKFITMIIHAEKK